MDKFKKLPDLLRADPKLLRTVHGLGSGQEASGQSNLGAMLEELRKSGH